MAHQLLISAFGKLADYDPMDGDQAELQSLERLSGFVYMHISGLLAASGGEPDTSEWVYPPLVVLNNTSRSSEERSTELLANVAQEPMSADEWMPLILHKHKLTMMQAEQQGFARLLAGYAPDISSEKLRDRFSDRPNHGIYQSVFAHSIDLEKKDTVDGLLGRETILQNVNITTNLPWFLHSMLKMIHAILFAIDWQSFDRQAKQKYITDTFNQYEAEFVSTLHTDKYKRKFKAFKRRHEKVLTSRKDLKKMFSTFHAALLFDPSWAPTTSYDSSTIGRTSTFPGTLKLLMTDMNPVQHADQTKAAFTQLIRELLPDPSKSYILGFLAKHSP